MKFEKDENYNDYTVVGYYIPPGENEAKLLSINDDGTFILGPDCFKQRGTLSFSFNLINSQEEVHLGSIDFEIRYAFGDSDTILPEPEEVWISLVTKVAKDAIKEDVTLVQQKAKEASQSALTASEKANEALEYANNAKDASNSAITAAGSAITAKDDAIAASNSASQFSDTAGKSAVSASDSANTAKTNANKTTEDRNEVERLVSGFDSHVVEKTTEFNQNATDKSGEFDSKVEQANTTINAKVTEATKQAEKATEEANRAEQATDGKLDKNLGAENAGKVLGIGQDGLIVPVENAGASDNIIYKDVAKSLNLNITDSFQRAMWNLKLYGQSTQENTTGSQLWVNPEPKTLNGVTLTIENDWAILNGTCTANGNISIIQRKLEAGEYTLSAEVEGSYPQRGTVVSQVYSANGGILTITTGGFSPITRELNSANNYEFRIFIRKDFVYNNYKVRTMLNKGSEALPWEPYTSGQPSPSPQYPQEITAISEFSGQVNNGSEQSQPFTYTPTQNMYSTQDGSICDYVDVEKGVEVYQLKKAVFNGTNATFIRLNDNNVYYTSLLSDAITPYDTKYEYYIWCDKLTTYKANQSIDSINNSIRYGNGGGASQLLFLKIDDTITTVQQLNTWLQSNPITIVYVVKTQTEISIQQEQLQMLRNLYTYTGVTNFLCNAPVSFAYERSLQIVINNLENALNTNALNIAVKE